MSYRQLIIGFARSGVLGYGGGPSVIPLIRYEAVEKYRWMSDEDFGDVLALANALPGPIATKMAAYIGYRVKGTSGAVVAILAHILPTVIAMIGLLGSLYALRESSVVSGMIRAVGPVIGVMLAVMAYEFFAKTWKGMGPVRAILVTLVSLLALQGLGIHPAVLIVVFLAVAFFKTTFKNTVASSAKGTAEKL
ncbi:chromate transporter [Effusibacillus pohliae]|uniref:chromate transporter n=1 Tax=Effusibacillus pohliae TaxID=232270 RepID=UPI000363A3E8|nr:chromate transporter [Effusibacillus pohliae]